MLERELSAKIKTFAKKNKIIAIKLTTLGQYGESGWPDLVFFKNKIVVFMELKKPGAESSDNQKRHQEALAAEGFTVYRDIDNFETAKLILHQEFAL